MSEDQNEVGLEEVAGDTTGRALALNNDDALAELKKEVQEEFITSDREVYKEALRSLMVQEQKLNRQRDEIVKQVEQDIKQLHEARVALDGAFKDGTLQSAQDARGVIREVGRRTATALVEREFGGFSDE